MHHLVHYVPHLTAMVLLIAASAFFSCSEAALFYLRRDQRDKLARGTLAQRTAVRLLEKPDRVLTSILFWNLLINMAYFALASIVAIGLARRGATTEAVVLEFSALLSVIVFCEMIPKNLGVVWPSQISGMVGLPLEFATRSLDPVAAAIGSVNRGVARVLFPTFTPEPYLELNDLERAINLSGGDKQLIEQERVVLSRIVALADTRVEEIMRPRLLYEAVSPPVSRSDLSPENTVGGYVLVTERDNEEISAVIDVNRAALSQRESLAPLAMPVLPVPWCATAADVLTLIDAKGVEVVAVLNELGETIGVLTRYDLLTTALQTDAVLDASSPRVGKIKPIADGQWEVAGMTTLRRFAKQLGQKLPSSKGITVSGMLQEQLRGMPQEDDEVDWAGFTWRVLRADHPALVAVLVVEHYENANDDSPTTPG